MDTGTPSGQSPWTLSTDQWIGGQFSLAHDTTLTEILGFVDGDPDQTLTFAIYRDEGSDVPGAELHSQAFTTDGSPGFQGLSGLSWMLSAGSYYVTAEVRRGQTFSGVMPGFTRRHPLGHEVFTQGGQWMTADGLDVGWRISDASATSNTTVPEPAAWALMLGGFGLAGAALRGRRAAVSA